MSISSALSNALSGLTANSRAANVVSTNLANILTEGYAPREVQLTTSGRVEGGVRVLDITRNVDEGLLSERRLADSAVAYQQTLAGFATRLEQQVGTPDSPSSLNALVASFEASLNAAAAKPEEQARLEDVVLRASAVADKINSISDDIQSQRTLADAQIETSVDNVNRLLEQVQILNAEIANSKNTGLSSAASEDQRQLIIDELSDYIPVRVVSRDSGTVALYTPGGAGLIDGAPAKLSFTASSLVVPHLTLSGGFLSGLEINGVPVEPSGDRSPIQGGRLAALFELRDSVATDAQTQIDATARNLIERFQSSGLDATRAPGDPGLFTDAGIAFDPLNEVGIAGRIEINSLVDSSSGGDVWRLRDGLGATAPGPAGNGALLLDYAAALSGQDSLATGGLGATQRDFSGHATALLSRFGSQRIESEQALSFAVTRQSGLVDLELQQGVDSDAELQRLLLIEQAYGANARMVQTVDELIQTLLRI